MVDKENSSNKTEELSLLGKELDPWLRRRLTKSTLMHTLLPVMLTRQPVTRLIANPPLVVPETPGIPLFRDTAFSGKKSDRASIFWSKIGLIWLTNSRKSQGTLNDLSNSFSGNMPKTNHAWPAPVYQSSSQLTDHLRKETLPEKPASKVTSASGIVPLEPGKKPLIDRSIPPVKTGLSTITSTSRSEQMGDTLRSSGQSNYKTETGPQPDSPPAKPSQHMEHTADSFPLSPDNLPGNKSGFKTSARDTGELSGNERAVTGIRQNQAAVVKRKEPYTEQTQNGAGMSVSKAGLSEPATGPIKHISAQDKPFASQIKPSSGPPKQIAGQSKPAIGQPEPAAGKPLSATVPTKHSDRPSKQARKYEPVARHFVPAARHS
jgi:hypothetical protein